jgi:hypothetical protein
MRALSSLLLVVCTLVVALGLAAISASLPNAVEEPERIPPVEATAGASPHAAVDAPDRTSAPPGTSSGDRVAESITRRPSSPSSPSGSWRSPLYPQNGVSLWDRVRSESQRDRKAFLIGTGIQVHTPRTAATPGPR